MFNFNKMYSYLFGKTPLSIVVICLTALLVSLFCLLFIFNDRREGFGGLPDIPFGESIKPTVVETGHLRVQHRPQFQKSDYIVVDGSKIIFGKKEGTHSARIWLNDKGQIEMNADLVLSRNSKVIAKNIDALSVETENLTTNMSTSNSFATGNLTLQNNDQKANFTLNERGVDLDTNLNVNNKLFSNELRLGSNDFSEDKWCMGSHCLRKNEFKKKF